MQLFARTMPVPRQKAGAISLALVWILLVAFGVLARTAAAMQDRLETGTVGVRSVTREQVFDGAIEAVLRSTISAQTAGEVIELPYDVNDFVAKGAVVVRLDDTRQKARLDKAVANEAEARARLVEAQDTFNRETRLLEEGATSKAKHENAKANLDSTRAKLKLAKAAVAEAYEELEHTVIRAPYSGIVVERFVEIGEQIQVGQPLGTGLSLEKLRVAVDVPGRYIDKVRQLQAARLLLPAGNKVSIATESLTVFPYADPKTHTFRVRVHLAEGDYGLYPGMLTKVAFKVGETEELVVPTRAIVQRSEVTGIYVVAEDGRVSFRQIRSGQASDDGWTVALAGLEAGETVALDPVQALIRLKQQTGKGHE